MSARNRDDVALAFTGLQALTNPHRFEALRLLREPATHFRPQAAGAPETVGVCVSDLQEKLGLSQSTTSQYLAVLERARLVTSHRSGQWTYWQSNASEIEAMVNCLAALVPERETQASPESNVPPFVTARDVFAARARIRHLVRHTPLERSPSLSRIMGGNAWIKWENLQFTRSCKPRGSLIRLLQLTPDERRSGISTAASGNQALGLAYAGAQLEIGVHVFFSETADAELVRSTRDFGAKATIHSDPEAAAQAAAHTEHRIYLPSSAHPAMIAGGGTIALELLDDIPEVDAVVVCVAGGSLASGIGLVLKAVRPELRVYAVQAESKQNLARRQAERRSAPARSSNASGPADSVERGELLSIPGFRRAVDGVVAASEEALGSAVEWAWQEHRLAVEFAGAAALAWVLSDPPELRGRCIAVCVTGGNVSSAHAHSLLRP